MIWASCLDLFSPSDLSLASLQGSCWNQCRTLGLLLCSWTAGQERNSSFPSRQIIFALLWLIGGIDRRLCRRTFMRQISRSSFMLYLVSPAAHLRCLLGVISCLTLRPRLFLQASEIESCWYRCSKSASESFRDQLFPGSLSPNHFCRSFKEPHWPI